MLTATASAAAFDGDATDPLPEGWVRVTVWEPGTLTRHVIEKPGFMFVEREKDVHLPAKEGREK